MDIIRGERFKKVMRILMKLGYTKLKTDLAKMGDDLEHSQNPVVRNLNTILLLGAKNMEHNGKSTWQSRYTLAYGQGLLWTVIKDTAYRDAFFWMIDKALEHPEELRKLLKPYVKPPEKWIPNLWQEGKDKTKELREKGELPKGSQSLQESVYTPPIQNKRHQKYFKNKKKK